MSKHGPRHTTAASAAAMAKSAKQLSDPSKFKGIGETFRQLFSISDKPKKKKRKTTISGGKKK